MIEPKKSLGQHFLNNVRIPERMTDAGEVEKGDIVLEIGPGTGVLTRVLLARGAHIIACEADLRAVQLLEQAFENEIKAKQLVILHTDVRALFDGTATSNLLLDSLGIQNRSYKVVANIPYYLSGMLFRMTLSSVRQPKILVYLVQREVAHRIALDPKESLLSLSVKVYGTPRYAGTVKPGNFTPPPRVDSAILAIYDISRDKLLGISEENFFTLIHAGFASKRKQLLGNLAKYFSRDRLLAVFSAFDIPLDVRGEDVSLDMWLSLAEALDFHIK